MVEMMKSKGKRDNKDFWVKKGQVVVVLGLDMGKDTVESLPENALIGKFQHKICRRNELKERVENSWKPLLGHLSSCHMLVKGWLDFDFVCPLDQNKIMEIEPLI